MGQIRFIPEGDRASCATLDEHGKFSLRCYDENDGVVPGRHQVEVGSVEHVSDDELKWRAPQKYADYQTSGLEFEIVEPTSDLVIELTWGGEQAPID